MTSNDDSELKGPKLQVVDFDPVKTQKIADYIMKQSRSDLTYLEVTEVINLFTALVDCAIKNINTIHNANGDPPKTI